MKQLVVISVALLCASSAPPALAQGPRAIIMLRHAERAEYDYGDGPLSAAGHARARVLAQTLRQAGVTAIYVSNQLRTLQTAAPLAEALQLQAVPVPGSDAAYVTAMTERLRAHRPSDVVLIVGHLNTFVPLLRAMGYTGDMTIGDFEHDDLFTVVPNPPGAPAVIRLNYGELTAAAAASDSAIIAVDQWWDTVRVRGDTAALARLLADEFVHTDETGVTGKRERLAIMAARGGAPAPGGGRSDEYRVQRRGPVAVLTHRVTEGRRAWRSTHVFVWRDGRWQAVAHHSSRIPD